MKTKHEYLISAALGVLAGIAVAAWSSCGETETVVLEALDGQDGQSCVIKSTWLVCPDGSSFDFRDLAGADGKDGIDGKDGLPGKDGESCLVIKQDSCAQIVCPDGDAWICLTPKPKCDNGNGNGPEGCSPSDNGNDDE